MKENVGTINVTPSKHIYRAIIADYSLNTGVCELVDNAIDQWVRDHQAIALRIVIAVDIDQQTIRVEDNAGGVKYEDLQLLVTPGLGSVSGGEELIGIFGVGSKRAGVALAQQVRVKTRWKSNNTYLLEYDDDWLEDESWELPVHQINSISASSTIVELSKLRAHISKEDVASLLAHLAATYARFLTRPNITIMLEGKKVEARTFDNFAFPPDYLPRRYASKLQTEDDHEITFTAAAGLINEPGSIAGDYGVYFYCNDRLIDSGNKSQAVGFIAGLAGAPHNASSLVRVLVFLSGQGVDMPWNSSKSAINTGHRTFRTIQNWIMYTVTEYAKVCQRYLGEWPEKVFKYDSGNYINEEIDDFAVIRKHFLPKLPPRRQNFGVVVQQLNSNLLDEKPWAAGPIEADIAVELIQKQKTLDQKNRLSLILLDSTLEIAYKDYLVNESGSHYSDKKLVELFEKRHLVETEIQKYVKLSAKAWKKLRYYYRLRNKLIHERATAGVKDKDIEDFRRLVRRVIAALFKVRWPSS